ncbi:MAG: endonuclease MutS2 [Candidatus Hydrothermia bacterium]
MRNKTLERLEFDKVKELLKTYISSPAGMEALESLVPEKSLDEVIEVYDHIRRMEKLIEKGTRLDFTKFPAIKKSVLKAASGAPLTFKEIREVGNFIEEYSKLYETLYGEFSSLLNPEILRPLKKSIIEIVDEEGNVKADATPELARLRKKIISLREEIYAILTEIMRKLEKEGVLRESIITIRNGRFVLPIVSNFKIEGIIHGYSKTSETVFVEPLNVVNLQNSYTKAVEEEREELDRIRREFSERIGKLAKTILTVYEQVGNIELLYACYMFKVEFDGVYPEFSDNYIEIVNGIHPVLKISLKDKVVPLNIKVSKRVFLVSGPNAGGKTVLLKTIGLFHILARAGIPIPAEKAVLVFPEEVFAVGFQDEQDIEEGESSFTSYIKEIVYVLENARPGYLVLFDELISSTDPHEASGLAYATLEELLGRNVWVFANTHLTPLKLLVSSNTGMINASMEFDPIMLKPTYRVRVGEIGVSHAFEIAERCGIPEDIIKRARKHMQGESALLEEVLNSLREKEHIYASLLKEYTEKLSELDEKVKKAEKIAREKASRIIEEARGQVERLLKEIRKEENFEKRRAIIKEVKKELQDVQKNYDLDLKPVQNLELNKEYYIKPIGATGILKEIKKEKVLVQIGKAFVEVPKGYLYERG